MIAMQDSIKERRTDVVTNPNLDSNFERKFERKLINLSTTGSLLGSDSVSHYFFR